MSLTATLDASLGRTDESSMRRRDAFLKWQCRVRQMAMRTAGGRPDNGIRPQVILTAGKPVGRITTVLVKRPEFSVTPEFRHMVHRTHDPADRREAAVKFLSASHYQRADEFCDELAATFPPDSALFNALRNLGRCRLLFDMYSQRFDLSCTVELHGQGDWFREAAYWHNRMFNSAMQPDTVVVGFRPDWEASTADPDF